MGRSHRPSWANGTAAAGSQRFTHVPRSMSVNALAGTVAAGAAWRAGAHRPREPTSAPARGQSKRREGLLSARSKVGVRIIVVRGEPRTRAAIARLHAPTRRLRGKQRTVERTRVKQKSLACLFPALSRFASASPTRRPFPTKACNVLGAFRRAPRSPWVPRNRSPWAWMTVRARRMRTRRIRKRWLTGGAQKCSKREKQGCR